MRTAWSKGRTAARLVAVFALALVALAGMCALAPAGTRGYAWAGERVLAEWDDIADGGNAWWSTDGSTLLNIERESGLAVILSPDSTLPVSTLVLTLSGDGTLTARFDELQPEESGQAWIEGWNLDFASAITGARLVADSDSDPEPVTDPVAVTFDLNGHGSFPEGTAVDGDGTATLEASGGSVAPPLPADAVYDFAGWFTADGARFTGAVTESTTVYARWVAEDPSVQSPVYSADSVTFNYYGPLADYDPLSDRVCVVGDFNSWGSAVNPMAYDETTGYWSATVPRSSLFYPDCLDTNGPNRYMFVDQSGNYFCDPLNPASDHGFSDFTIPHIFSEEWTYDAGYHWHACLYEGCDEQGGWAEHDLDWKTEDGKYWPECLDGCGYVAAAPRDVPQVDLECPDAVCPGQDFACSFVLPEGAVGAAMYSVFPHAFGTIEMDVEDGVARGTIPAQWYEQGEESFELHVYAVMDDGYYALVALERIGVSHDLVQVAAREATVEEEGCVEHWACARCGKLFLDGDGEHEVPPADLVIEKLPPSIVEGEGQRVAQGEERPLSFRSNAAFADFICVMVDGEEIGGELYTAEEGSTLVTLLGSFVAGLPAGEHTIGVVSQSGTATAGFTVTEKGDNGDGEGDNGGTGVGDGNGGSGTGDSQGGQDQGAGKTDRPSIPRTADGSPLLPAALLAAGGAALCGMGALAARRGRSS